MPEPVHAQPSAAVDECRRQQVKRGADLCRAQPAVWSAMVRYGDELVRDGMIPEEAHDHAWATFVGGSTSQSRPST